jgi:hypothetical protein
LYIHGDGDGIILISILIYIHKKTIIDNKFIKEHPEKYESINLLIIVFAMMERSWLEFHVFIYSY